MSNHTVSYRDPFYQWAQAAYDPESPEAIASVNRAKSDRLDIWIGMLADDIQRQDMESFDRLFSVFLREDPDLLRVLKSRITAMGLVREYLRRKRE